VNYRETVPGTRSLPRWAKARWEFDLGVARPLGAVMVVLGATIPHLPHNPGLPCPLRSVTGVPCPFCGLTTSVKGVCTGHLRAGVTANPFGLLAVGVALFLVLRPRVRTVTVPVLCLATLAAASWGWELQRFGWLPWG
jgi:hypothetical protein